MRVEPAVFASYIDQVGVWFNNAQVMVERNNHGHSVILWLKDNSGLALLAGRDGNPGWMSSSVGKSIMYSTLTDSLRDKRLKVHNELTYDQLGSIEGATLRAPKKLHDDCAMSFALAAQALLGEGIQISTAYRYTNDVKTVSRRAKFLAGQLR
jgi:hypothetical protein